jgi:hypothetical protein
VIKLCVAYFFLAFHAVSLLWSRNMSSAWSRYPVHVIDFLIHCPHPLAALSHCINGQFHVTKEFIHEFRTLIRRCRQLSQLIEGLPQNTMAKQSNIAIKGCRRTRSSRCSSMSYEKTPNADQSDRRWSMWRTSFFWLGRRFVSGIHNAAHRVPDCST